MPHRRRHPPRREPRDAGRLISTGIILRQNSDDHGIQCSDNNESKNNGLYEGVIYENNVFLGPGVVPDMINPGARSRKAEFKRTLIQQGASIGANAIVCSHTIDHSSVRTVITKDVPAYAPLIMGNPSKRNRLDE